jgi:hypothetical protein
MEITMTTGARYFPQFGPLAARGEFWSGCVLAAPSGVRRLRTGRFHGALINPIGTDLPVTDRMRASAAEP